MKRKSESITEQTEQPKIIVLYSDDGGDNHEPPVGVGGDPVYIDAPYDLPQSEMLLEDGLKEDAPRYYKYKFARGAKEEPYFNLDTVRVLTEKGDASGYVNFVEYKIPRNRISRLRLWLGDASGEPEIIIVGKNGGSILSAQPFDERRSANPPKNNRKKRHYFPDRDVRAVKWDIVDENNTILIDPATENGTLTAANDDQYYFYVSFAHELPALELS